MVVDESFFFLRPSAPLWSVSAGETVQQSTPGARSAFNTTHIVSDLMWCCTARGDKPSPRADDGPSPEQRPPAATAKSSNRSSNSGNSVLSLSLWRAAEPASTRLTAAAPSVAPAKSGFVDLRSWMSSQPPSERPSSRRS